MSPGEIRRLILDGVEDSLPAVEPPLKSENDHHAEVADLLVVTGAALVDGLSLVASKSCGK